jgi:hypothetical protein
LPVGVDTVENLPRRFDEMTAAGADGYLVMADPRVGATQLPRSPCAIVCRVP